MKFLVIGLGSMGRRRIRNLLALKVPKDNVRGFDIDPKRRLEAGRDYGIRASSNFKKIWFEFKPQVFIISTPPDKQAEYFLWAAKHKISFFKEVGTDDRGYEKLSGLLDGSFVAAPSCSFRYHSAARNIKKIIAAGKLGKVLAFTYHLGQYLPDWHPWEDYRKVYFSKKKTGACREMFPYELRWLDDAFQSRVIEITGMTEKVSDLDMQADDLYSAIVRYENGIIGNLTIDLISRLPKRTLRILGSEGVLDWEWQDNRIKLFSASSKKHKTIRLNPGRREKDYVTAEDIYILEMKDFLQAVAGKKKFPYTFAEDWRVLKILQALEKSARARKAVKI